MPLFVLLQILLAYAVLLVNRGRSLRFTALRRISGFDILCFICPQLLVFVVKLYPLNCRFRPRLRRNVQVYRHPPVFQAFPPVYRYLFFFVVYRDFCIRNIRVQKVLKVFYRLWCQHGFSPPFKVPDETVSKFSSLSVAVK